MRFKAKTCGAHESCSHLQLKADCDLDEQVLFRIFKVLDSDCVESMVWLSEFFGEQAKLEVREIERQQGREQ